MTDFAAGGWVHPFNEGWPRPVQMPDPSTPLSAMPSPDDMIQMMGQRNFEDLMEGFRTGNVEKVSENLNKIFTRVQALEGDVVEGEEIDVEFEEPGVLSRSWDWTKTKAHNGWIHTRNGVHATTRPFKKAWHATTSNTMIFLENHPVIQKFVGFLLMALTFFATFTIAYMIFFWLFSAVTVWMINMGWVALV